MSVRDVSKFVLRSVFSLVVCAFILLYLCEHKCYEFFAIKYYSRLKTKLTKKEQQMVRKNERKYYIEKLFQDPNAHFFITQLTGIRVNAQNQEYAKRMIYEQWLLYDSLHKCNDKLLQLNAKIYKS